jgi:hypothetical protein
MCMMPFALAFILSAPADNSPSAVLERAREAFAILGDAQKVFVRRMKQTRPIPDVITLYDRKRWPPEDGECFYLSPGKMKLTVIDGNEAFVVLGGERYIIRSQYVSKTLDDPSFTWPRTLVAIGEGRGGNLIIDEINASSRNIVAVLEGQAMERRSHAFSRAGRLFFRDLSEGKFRCWKDDGSDVVIEAKDLAEPDLKWIREYRAKEALFRECRAIESDSNAERRAQKIKLFDELHK